MPAACRFDARMPLLADYAIADMPPFAAFAAPLRRRHRLHAERVKIVANRAPRYRLRRLRHYAAAMLPDATRLRRRFEADAAFIRFSMLLFCRRFTMDAAIVTPYALMLSRCRCRRRQHGCAMPARC